MRIAIGLAAAAALILAGAAHGKGHGGPHAPLDQDATPATPAQGGPERLVVGPVPGAPWKRITDKSGPQGWIHEQVPASHADTDYSEMLTDQAFVANRGVDPVAFLQKAYSNFGGACEGTKASGPTPRMEGGLKVAYGQVRCGTQRGQRFGVHVFYKVIGGHDALYSISREMRVPPSADGDLLSFPKGQEAAAGALMKAEGETDRYLAEKVYVCGGGATDGRCAR